MIFIRLLEEVNEYAKRLFEDNALHMIDNLHYAKLPLHWKPSIVLTYLENGTWDRNCAHLERELELSGLQNHNDSSTSILLFTKNWEL